LAKEKEDIKKQLLQEMTDATKASADKVKQPAKQPAKKKAEGEATGEFHSKKVKKLIIFPIDFKGNANLIL
jgi:hypothetical protein